MKIWKLLDVFFIFSNIFQIKYKFVHTWRCLCSVLLCSVEVFSFRCCLVRKTVSHCITHTSNIVYGMCMRKMLTRMVWHFAVFLIRKTNVKRQRENIKNEKRRTKKKMEKRKTAKKNRRKTKMRQKCQNMEHV